MKHRLGAYALLAFVTWLALVAGAQAAEEFGFSRIVHGWTNYSTAFNTTHDSGLDAEYATIGCYYTPAVNARPVEFSAVVIWFGRSGQRLDFSEFSFQVHLWSSLAAFIRDPRRGDLAAIPYAAPTGGSTTTPDATTRGGRPAYLVRFNLTNSLLVLTQCQTVLLGLSAHADANRSGELYVPTAPYQGMSDVQAGNIVAFGWTHLIDAGGLTVYWGQLATELSVQPLNANPRLALERIGSDVRLTWPAAAGCLALESSESLGGPTPWAPVDHPPLIVDGLYQLQVGMTNADRWFRLRWEPPSVFSPLGDR